MDADGAAREVWRKVPVFRLVWWDQRNGTGKRARLQPNQGVR